MMRFKDYLTEVISLRGKDPALDAFMKEFYEHTFANPIEPRMRIWGSTEDAVGIKAVPFNGKIQLDAIISFIAKNAGHASKALKWFCDLADKHQVKIELYVKPLQNAGSREGKNLNKLELRNWYARNGFVKAPQADTMIREPKDALKESTQKALGIVRCLEKLHVKLDSRLLKVQCFGENSSKIKVIIQHYESHMDDDVIKHAFGAYFVKLERLKRGPYGPSSTASLAIHLNVTLTGSESDRIENTYYEDTH